MPGGLETPADYSATIDWGDGTSGPGTLGISGNTITVSGQHTYGFTTSGILHPTVTLNDDTGGSETANDTIFVARRLGQGKQARHRSDLQRPPASTIWTSR